MATVSLRHVSSNSSENLGTSVGKGLRICRRGFREWFRERCGSFGRALRNERENSLMATRRNASVAFGSCRNESRKVFLKSWAIERFDDTSLRLAYVRLAQLSSKV